MWKLGALLVMVAWTKIVNKIQGSFDSNHGSNNLAACIEQSICEPGVSMTWTPFTLNSGGGGGGRGGGVITTRAEKIVPQISL